jgi:holo-[acyl-carrier protein] synthase
MIRGMGIDAVETERFVSWHLYSRTQLSRVFSPDEIEYCLSIPVKSAERFAARFAAKEAFFKALSAAVPDHGLSLLTILRNVSVIRRNGAPILQVNWQFFGILEYTVHVSFAHEKMMAIALVVFEE